jgi:hypothetical protein
MQTPIARLPEIIFHNFLFTIMIIEMFAFVFLLFKLIILPISLFFIRKWKPTFGKISPVDNSISSESSSIQYDLESTTSGLNKQENNEHQHNDFIASNATPFEKQMSTLNHDANHNEHDSQQPPSVADIDVVVEPLRELVPVSS